MEKAVIWTNPVLQGSTICQPVRLEYRKESADAAREINTWLKDGAASMPPLIIHVGEKMLKFMHVV